MLGDGKWNSGDQGSFFKYQYGVLKLLEQINASIVALPGVDYETRTTIYQATAPGPGYSIGDIIVRYDIIDVATSTLAATIWFNQTTQTTIAAPAPANITPYNPPSNVTVSNPFNLQATQLLVLANQTNKTQFSKLTDGVDDASILPASTPAVATDTALVVAISPNNTVPISAATLPLPAGAATSANQTTVNTQTTKLNDGTDTALITALGELNVIASPQPGVDIGDVTVTNLPTTVDTNFGVVGASTLRSAAQIGNVTGAADFNNGAPGAQTLRVTLANGAQAITSSAETSAGSPGSVAAGATSVGFTTNTTFVGSINGVAREASTFYGFEAAPGKTLPAISWTITAGSMIIDKIV